MVEQFDYIVIGGGSGGLASARRAAKYGARSLVIEGQRLGGTCVNIGCIPKKIMWNGTQIIEEIQMAAQYGITVPSYSLNFQELKRRREAHIAGLNQIFATHLQNEGVEWVQGWATFVDPHTIEVGSRRFTAPHICIATGSKSIPLPVKGREHVVYSDYIFEMDQLPTNILIIGDGYIAVEMAGILATMGCQVTLAVMLNTIMPRFDWDVAEMLREELVKIGVTVIRNTLASEVKQVQGGYQVFFKNGTFINCEVVMAAIGRFANVDGLGIDRIGIELNKLRFVPTNEKEETVVPGVYAIGDVAGKILLTPVAVAAGRALAERLFNNPETIMNYQFVPTVMFSHPPVGQVGYTEEEARNEFGEQVRVYKTQFNSLFYAVSTVKSPTLLKMICLGPEERVIGLVAVGRGADEMIQGYGVAVRAGLRKQDFNNTVAIHPTASEDFVLL